MKLFVAMPVNRDMPWQTVASLTYLMRSGIWKSGWEFKMLAGCGYLSDARNRLTAEFLRSSCDRLLWVDSDMMFKPADVARVSSHQEEVVGGLYYKRKVEADVCCQGMPGLEKSTSDARGLIEVARIGTGFLCMTREVFRTMAARVALDVYTDEEGREQRDYWPTRLVGEGKQRGFLGEDYAFCDAWRAIGGRIWADAMCQVGHVGHVVFPVMNQ
jgi:hypothetical protein